VRWVFLLSIASVGGCNATHDSATEAPTRASSAAADVPFQSAPTAGNAFTVQWRPVGGAVPVNELFAIEVRVFELGPSASGATALGAPVTGATVQASAWMPEHMHGMSRSPQTVEREPGRYVVSGMLLHMEGKWQLFVDVMAGKKSGRAEFAIDLASKQPLPTIEGFTPDEVRGVLELSPLPPPPADPTNRVADDPRAARLGQFLFFDRRFSSSGQVACATCHQPDHAFTDAKQLGDAGLGELRPEGSAKASGRLDRHTPSLFDVAYQRWFFWDGRADSLWAQALRPLEDPREHATSRLAIAHALADDADLSRAYTELFGPLPELGDARRFPPKGKPGDAAFDAMAPGDRAAIDRVFANFGKAVEAYERRLVSRDAPFDQFVAAVRAGDAAKQRHSLSAAAREGARLFVGAARCVRCHSGPNFTDREFHDNRVPTLTGEPRRDAGRQNGIATVLADPFNGTGACSDAPNGPADEKLRYLSRVGDHWSEFKTPSLRNVAVTAPYMHQGQFATLDEVLDYYNSMERAVPSHSPERTLQPLHFQRDQLAALRAFLESLTDVKLDPALLVKPASPLLH
jgi:cytochrome c peroxidase